MSSDAVVEKGLNGGEKHFLSFFFFFFFLGWCGSTRNLLVLSWAVLVFFETHFFFFFFFCLDLCSGSKVLSRFVVVTDMFSYMAFLEFFSGMLLWCC